MSQAIQKRIAFIGAGQMCEAIFSGLIRSGAVSPEHILLYDVNESRLADLQNRYHTNILLPSDHAYEDLVSAADIVFLSVRPQDARETLSGTGRLFRPEQTVISIMGGVQLSFLEEYIQNAAVVRVMPNTPMLVMEGAAGIALGARCTSQTEALAKSLFDVIGISYVLPESLIDPLTGISGCGPAFAYLFIESLADGGVEMGLSREMALSLAAQCLIGAGKMVLNTNTHPGILKDRVCSPGGGTIAGVHTLEEGKFRGVVMDAVVQSIQRMQNVGDKA
jgi:pyrroline-5-carboxylate reductase